MSKLTRGLAAVFGTFELNPNLKKEFKDAFKPDKCLGFLLGLVKFTVGLFVVGMTLIIAVTLITKYFGGL